MNPTVEVADLSNVIMSLGLVLAFIFAAAWVVRKMPFGGAVRRSGDLKVVAALPLGPKERLLIVQARDQELLIAVSPAGVFNLGAGAAQAAPRAVPTAAEPPAPVFALGERS